MSRINPLMFNPCSIFKYHRAFWMEADAFNKKLLSGCITATAIFTKTARHFLDVKTNLLLPNRFSFNQDTALIVLITYVLFTVTVGFTKYILKKETRRERIIELEKKVLQLNEALLKRPSN